MDPQPSGKRELPPWLAKIGLAEFEPRKRSVLVALSQPEEQKLFCDSFSRLGWRVWIGDFAEVVFTVEAFRPQVIITDQILLAPGLRAFMQCRFVSIVVVADDEEAERVAYSEGADFVLVRPIEPQDPLGLTHL